MYALVLVGDVKEANVSREEPRQDVRTAGSLVIMGFETERRHRVAGKKTKLEPTRRASKDLREYVRRAKAMRDRFAAEDRCCSDSTEIIRADRDSRA